MKQEDDLVAHSWRLVRATQPHLAITIDLAALFQPYEDPERLRLHQGVVLDMAARSGSEAFLMRSGDMALVMPPDALQDWQTLVDDMIDVFAKDAGIPEDTLRRRVVVYSLPGQIWEFRSWIARYTSGGSLAQETGADADDGLQGRLNAEMLSRMEQRILRCDIRPFIQRQMVYARGGGAKTSWSPLIEERLIGVSELGKQLFPDVDIAQSSPFFGKFCSILDDRLMHHIMSGSPRFESRISINISLNTLFGGLFEAFAARIPVEERQRLHIELHCGELFREIGRAQEAIDRVRGHGFGIVVDGLTLELLPYVRVNKFDCDFLKINLPKGDVRKLVDDACIKAIRSLSRDKIVFSRCDHESALQIGQMLDVRMYQGGLVDTQIRKEIGRS